MDGDNVKRCDCQKIDAWSLLRHLGFVVEGGGRERRLWIVDSVCRSSCMDRKKDRNRTEPQPNATRPRLRLH